MKKTKNKEAGSLGGLLLVWVIGTIAFMIYNLVVNFSNPVGWVLNILLLASLIMVIGGEGTRWLMVITGVVFGVIFLYSTMTISPYDTCLRYWRECMAAGSARDIIMERMAQGARVGGIIMTSYMFVSSVYFILSRRVKARFAK